MTKVTSLKTNQNNSLSQNKAAFNNLFMEEGN